MSLSYTAHITRGQPALVHLPKQCEWTDKKFVIAQGDIFEVDPITGETWFQEQQVNFTLRKERKKEVVRFTLTENQALMFDWRFLR